MAEREREWTAVKTQQALELERVRGELEEFTTQCQLLRDSSEQVNLHNACVCYAVCCGELRTVCEV